MTDVKQIAELQRWKQNQLNKWHPNDWRRCFIESRIVPGLSYPPASCSPAMILAIPWGWRLERLVRLQRRLLEIDKLCFQQSLRNKQAAHPQRWSAANSWQLPWEFPNRPHTFQFQDNQWTSGYLRSCPKLFAPGSSLSWEMLRGFAKLGS